MKRAIFFILGIIFCMKMPAQIFIKPIPKQIPQKINSNSRTTKIQAITDTITLPFWDDFSYDSQDPDTSYWLIGKDVLINSGQGINPPTLNVATFDGLNAQGKPYSNSDFVSSADSLESKPIDLSLISKDKRLTVYLSFYWQMKGQGESPDETDSIRLQFFTINSKWITKWKKSGLPSNLSENFTQEYIQVNDEKYFHQGFKFRFQNFGNTTGPFDSWHLDYIYLNQDRTSINESIFDHAIAIEPVSLFNTYTNIPYSQLFVFPDTIFTPYTIGISSQERNRQNVQYVYSLTDSISNQRIYFEHNNSDLLKPLGRAKIITNTINNSIFNPNTDSLIINAEFQFITGDKLLIKSINNGGADTTFLKSDSFNFRVNDTLRRTYVIHKTLSYDDGTADFAAGINQKNGQIAVEYTIAVSDTLTALDIYFPDIGTNAGGQSITLSVLKDLSGKPGSVLIYQKNELVKFSSNINEFVRYKLINPIIVSGTFYIVFEQIRGEFIGIGLDKNNPQPNKIYSNTLGFWEKNNSRGVNGSLMFRAIFGKSNAVITNTETINSDNTINVYPNPVKENLYINGNYQNAEMYTISGKKINIKMDRNEINVSNLQNGIYLLRIKGKLGITIKKIIISH